VIRTLVPRRKNVRKSAKSIKIAIARAKNIKIASMKAKNIAALRVKTRSMHAISIKQTDMNVRRKTAKVKKMAKQSASVQNISIKTLVNS
jgi:hypothetical protein